MRILLLRGIGLLHLFPRERSFSSARAIVRVSSDICYGAKLQGDGGYASSDRPNLRVSEISWLGRLESVPALDPLLYRAVVNRRIAHRFLYLRKTARHRLADEFRSLSTQIFMGYFHSLQRQVCWPIVVCRAYSNANSAATLVCTGFHLCFSTSRPHSSVLAVIDRVRPCSYLFYL